MRWKAIDRPHWVVVKSLGMVLLWLAASGVAVGVAWTGVGIISHEFEDPPSVEFVQVREATGFDTSAADATAPPVSDLGSGGGSSGEGVVEPQNHTTTTATAEPPAVPSTPPTSQGGLDQVAPAGDGGNTTVTTTAPASSSPSTSEPPTTAPSTTGPAPRSITFTLTGGTTAIIFAPDAVSVAWATPEPGFTVDIDDHGDEIRVTFTSDTHRSRIEAGWDGTPQIHISEEPRHDDSDDDVDQSDIHD